MRSAEKKINFSQPRTPVGKETKTTELFKVYSYHYCKTISREEKLKQYTKSGTIIFFSFLCRNTDLPALRKE